MSSNQADPLAEVRSVKFDLRFDPDSTENDVQVTVRTELVTEFASHHVKVKEIAGISLYPVARVGKSGSEVFYLDLFYTDQQRPEKFIAKFQDIKSTTREAAGAETATIAGFCPHFYSFKNAAADLGLIVYRLAKSRDYVEFREFFLDLKNPDAQCASALESIYRTVAVDTNSKAPPKTLIDDYDRYVNRKSKPLQRIEALCNAAQAQSGIGEIAKSIYDAYSRIQTELNVEVQPYLVHGDLHARNLILSKSNPSQTELIDFDWVHSGHPAKDFVLMEFTLKYMLLQELLPKAAGLDVSSLHIQPKRFEAFEQFLCKHGFDLPSKETMVVELFGEDVPPHQILALSRVYACLTQIRCFAGKVLREYCKNDTSSLLTPEMHYFAGFFLVTVGLFAYAEVDQLAAMIGLQTVGAKF